MTIPAVADVPQLLRRLTRQEDQVRRALAELEARLRRFEDVERPAYDTWLRLELGPLVTRVEETAAELRARQMLAERVTELVEDEGLHPREALWAVQEAPARRPRRDDDEPSREEIAARRRAKLERKRADRKQAKRARRRSATAPEVTNDDGASVAGPARRRLVALYRGLARRLHPDSPMVVATLAPARRRTVWAEVQAAYASGSVERLLALSAWMDTVGATGVAAAGEEGRDGAPVLSLAERHEHLRARRRSVRALERRLTELAREPAWGFASATPAALRRLRQAATRGLEAELAEGRTALADLDDFFAGIGAPRAPRAQRQWRARRR